jgi:hypothetical protein
LKKNDSNYPVCTCSAEQEPLKSEGIQKIINIKENKHCCATHSTLADARVIPRRRSYGARRTLKTNVFRAKLRYIITECGLTFGLIRKNTIIKI